MGYYTVSVEAKNRLAFPSKYKELTGNKLLITNWFEKSLLVLPTKEWERVVLKVLKIKSSLLPETRDLKRFIYGGAKEVELDQQGRFVLPRYLREYAHIEGRSSFVGCGEYIELWDSAIWESYTEMMNIQIKETARKAAQNLNE